MMHELDQYQIWTDEVSEYEESQRLISFTEIYPILGLSGEVGELIEKIKKAYRNNPCYPDIVDIPGLRQEVYYELGDILFYIARIAKLFGYLLSEILKGNQEKLNDRKKRNVICNQGDNR